MDPEKPLPPAVVQLSRPFRSKNLKGETWLRPGYDVLDLWHGQTLPSFD